MASMEINIRGVAQRSPGDKIWFATEHDYGFAGKQKVLISDVIDRIRLEFKDMNYYSLYYVMKNSKQVIGASDVYDSEEAYLKRRR